MKKLALFLFILLFASCKNFDLNPDDNCGVLNGLTTRKTIFGKCYYIDQGKKVFLDKKYCPC